MHVLVHYCDVVWFMLSQIVEEQEVGEDSVVVSEDDGGETSAVTEHCRANLRTSGIVLPVCSVTSKNCTHCAADFGWWSAAPRHWQACLAMRLTKLSSCPWGQHGVCSAFTFVLYQSGLFVTVLVLWQSVSSALESFCVCIVEGDVKDVTILCRLLLTGVA